MSEDRNVETPHPAVYGGFRVSLLKIGLFLLCAAFWFLLLLLNAALTWWMLLILALPTYVVTEWVGAKLFAAKYGWSTEQVGFSPKRIALGVLLVLGISAAAYLVFRMFN